MNGMSPPMLPLMLGLMLGLCYLYVRSWKHFQNRNQLEIRQLQQINVRSYRKYTVIEKYPLLYFMKKRFLRHLEIEPQSQLRVNPLNAVEVVFGSVDPVGPLH